MIHLNNIYLQFGEKIIFENASWHIKANSRYALIGRNGVGKTTLLKILTGQQDIDKGEIKVRGNLKIAYLPQEHKTDSKKTVLKELMEDNKEIMELKKQLENLEKKLENGKDELLDKYTKLSSDFEHLGGFDFENKAKMILSGIGFKKEDFDKPVNSFSGGWRMRIYLSKLLLRNPDLLLLDEPTNHLDLPALIWLENYLASFKGTLILITHDRDFLNKVTNSITEISNGKITPYKGNYNSYLKQKKEKEEQLYKQYQKQLEEIENLTRFIDKFKAKATKAAQARSKMKQLEKIKENLIKLPPKTSNIKLHIPLSVSSGKEVLHIKNLKKSYDKKIIFENAETEVLRGERIAIVGENGIGKTTFLKITANLTPFSGTVKYGHNVKISYFGQHQIDELNLDNDILTEVQSHADFEDIPYIRKILGGFMFTKDTVFQKISTLSGGEKSRVALVKILLEKSNLLLLDEPTNHLDMETKELLLKALKEYKGTIIFVSHDKYFIENLADNIISIKEKKLIKYNGGLEYFLEKNADDKTENKTLRNKIKNKNIISKKEQKRYEAEIRQKKSKILKPLKEKLDKLENEIEKMEKEKEKILEEISKPEFYSKSSEYISSIHKKNKNIEKKLETLQNDWENLATEIEEIEKKFSI